VWVQQVSLENCIGDFEPRVDTLTTQVENRIFAGNIAGLFRGKKRMVVQRLMDGYNFNEIARENKLKQSEVYKIKEQLKMDLSFLRDGSQREVFVKNNFVALNQLLENIKVIVNRLTLAEYIKLYLYEYDQEAIEKNWQTTELQNVFESIWENNQKSCVLAPREHLKTYTIIAYLTKKLFTRTYPLDISYYHIKKELAFEKFRKIQRTIEKNPILASGLEIDKAQYWSEDKIVLADGSTIEPLSYQSRVVGKHPHIIVIDDPIDKQVIYSDQQNQKAIDKFYMDIYPQISSDEKEKKILIIGTKQRKGDLYGDLPEDFKTFIFKAIDEDGNILCPELFSRERLAQIKKAIVAKHGEKYWLKEYMNVPFEAMGIVIKEAWIKYYYNIEDEIKAKLKIYQGWDLSVGKDVEKGDWTAGATIGILDDEKIDEKRIYVLDMFRARLDFGGRVGKVIEYGGIHKPLKIGIEDNVFQYDTVQEAKKKSLLPIIGVKSITNKIESFNTELAPYFENGKVFIRHDMKDLVNEILSLPVGEYDDQADALKIAIKTGLTAKGEPRIRRL